MINFGEIDWSLLDGNWVEYFEFITEKGKTVRQLTFLGVVKKYAPFVFHNLGKMSSLETYLRLLNSVILPNIDGHNEVAVGSYTIELLEQSILNIKLRGKTRGTGPREPYENSTINHCILLMSRVIRAAYEVGELKQNILWGSCFAMNEKEIKTCRKEYEQKIRKFSTEDDGRIQKELFSSPSVKGQYLCLILCDVLALRINEACASNWSDIRPIDGHPEAYALWVYETTEIDSNELKASGKTRNADRVIPIPDVLMSFLRKRMSWLEEKLGYSVQDSVLPIGCYEADYERRCYTPEITAAARELFQKCQISPKILASLDLELKQDDLCIVIQEKEATAYCFRRNGVTIYSFLGLSDAEISYLIGHRISDGVLTRNEYTNPDVLYGLWRKINKRILCGVSVPGENEMQIGTYSGEGPVRLCLPDGAKNAKIRVQAIEQGDAIRISFPDGVPDGVIIDVSKPGQASGNVNVIKQYKKLYGGL